MNVEREVKAYAVLENEVHSLRTWNTLANTFATVGFALVSFAIGIWTNALFAETLTPSGSLLTKVGAPLFCILAVVAFFVSWRVGQSRSEAWEAIKRESKQPASATESGPPTPLTRQQRRSFPKAAS